MKIKTILNRNRWRDITIKGDNLRRKEGGKNREKERKEGKIMKRRSREEKVEVT